MRIIVILASWLLPLTVFAQETVHVKGRIVNEQGETVEYVHVGIPKYETGTVSSLDGRFEIDVPADTLEFHHVSYETAAYPLTGPEEDLVIVLRELELPPAVSIGGNTKEKLLVKPGTKVPGGVGDFHRPDGTVKGMELGTVATARKPFLIQHILFTILSNRISGCVAAINIYRIEGEPETFVNVLRRPIYVTVPVSDAAQLFDIRPDETILLEPGRYFVAFQLLDCEISQEHLITPLYLKSSYQRSVALGEMKHFPVNIGISVKGLEYN